MWIFSVDWNTHLSMPNNILIYLLKFISLSFFPSTVRPLIIFIWDSRPTVFYFFFTNAGQFSNSYGVFCPENSFFFDWNGLYLLTSIRAAITIRGFRQAGYRNAETKAKLRREFKTIALILQAMLLVVWDLSVKIRALRACQICQQVTKMPICQDAWSCLSWRYLLSHSRRSVLVNSRNWSGGSNSCPENSFVLYVHHAAPTQFTFDKKKLIELGHKAHQVGANL